MLCFLSSFVGSGKIYLALLNMSALNGFIMWFVVALCYYRFRRGYLLQGYQLEKLTYAAKWFPFSPLFAMVACGVIILGQNVVLLTEDTLDWFSIISINLCIVIFIFPYLFYRFKYGSKLIALKDIDYKNKDTSF